MEFNGQTCLIEGPQTLNNNHIVYNELLTELPLEFSEATERCGDELSIFAFYVFQDVFSVQTDGIRNEKGAVQVS